MLEQATKWPKAIPVHIQVLFTLGFLPISTFQHEVGYRSENICFVATYGPLGTFLNANDPRHAQAWWNIMNSNHMCKCVHDRHVD